MNEVWKDVVGYEGLYEVSDLGNIRSKSRTIHIVQSKKEYDLVTEGKALKPQPLRHGYVGVWLYGKEAIKGRNGKLYSVHRLVAKAFCPNPNDYPEVNHINEDKTDNRACNLEWCSHKANSCHGTRGQRIGRSNTNGKQSKKVYQFTFDGELVAEYPSMAEVQRSTGFRKGNIWAQMVGKAELAYGYKWSHTPSI